MWQSAMETDLMNKSWRTQSKQTATEETKLAADENIRSVWRKRDLTREEAWNRNKTENCKY